MELEDESFKITLRNWMPYPVWLHPAFSKDLVLHPLSEGYPREERYYFKRSEKEMLKGFKDPYIDLVWMFKDEIMETQTYDSDSLTYPESSIFKIHLPLSSLPLSRTKASVSLIQNPSPHITKYQNISDSNPPKPIKFKPTYSKFIHKEPYTWSSSVNLLFLVFLFCTLTLYSAYLSCKEMRELK
jgi:hypothetical protein